MKKLNALIFDVDGTLAETEEAHRIAFNEIFKEYDLNWDWDVQLYGELLAVAGGKERIKFYIENYLPDFKSPDNLTAWIAKLHQQKTARYNEIITNRPIELRPGIRRLIEQARREKIRLAIATTTSLPNVSNLLKASLAPDAITWFDVIAAGDMVSAKKPDPELYHYALKELALPAEQCIAFEDSKIGLQSAMGANIPTLITASFYTRHQDFTGALLALDNLGEPEHPFTVLAGDAGNARYVDIALLQMMNGE
jgi:HAD superfamily hydrolase (TIGR01509 family)